MTKQVKSIVSWGILCIVAGFVVSERWSGISAYLHVNRELDELVKRAKDLDLELIKAGTLNVADVLDRDELIEYVVDGRISVTESASGLDPVVICRSSSGVSYGIAFVYRGYEVYRTHNMGDAIRFFVEPWWHSELSYPPRSDH